MGSGNLRVVCVALFSATGAFLFGLDIGYIAQILDCASFKRDVVHLKNWNDPDAHIPPMEEGLIVSMFSVGAIVSACPFVSGFFLEYYGRKVSIGVGAVIFILGGTIQALAHSVASMFVGRFIAGCSIGLMSAVVSLYQSEVAPKDMRGALTSLYQLMITFGILVAVMLDAAFVEQDGGWRIAIGIQCLPAFALLAAMPVLPRSPRWLMKQCREAEALEVLRLVRSTEEEAKAEFEEIKAELAGTEHDQPAWSELLHGRVKQLLIIGLCLQLLQQLVGMNAFMYFGPSIFAELKYDATKMQWLTTLVNFVSTFPALFLADSCGRRTLLMWSSAGMCVVCLSMAVLGFYMQLENLKSEAVPSFVRLGIVGSVFLFVVNFAYGWGPIVWVYCAEMFPLRHRARCVGVCSMANWIGNFIIAQCTPYLLDTLGFSTFFVFGVFCAMSLALAAWLPETKGVMLEQMHELFDKKLGIQADVPLAKTWMKSYGSAENQIANVKEI